MNLKRILSFSLATLTVLPFAACGGKTETTATNNSAETTAAETTAAETDPYYAPEMEEVKNYGGKTLTVLTRSGMTFAENEFGVTDSTGEVVDDAVYSRDLKAMETYNFKLVSDPHTDDWAHHGEFDSLIHESVLAGDGTFDLIAGYQCCLSYNVAWGDLLDLMQLSYLSLGEKWWSQEEVDTLQVNGRLYYAGGDICKSVISGLQCMYFNKNLAEDYGTPDIYDLVREKKWTHDKFLEVIKGTYQDVDGNGTKDETDVYGYYMVDYPTRNYLVAYNTPTLEVDQKTGKPQLVLNTQRTVNALQKVVAMSQTNDVYYGTKGTDAFKESRTLILAGQFSTASSMREMDDDFGIIPFPMFDEEQGEYYASMANSSSMMAIPVTAEDKEMSAYLCEAMCRLSYTLIRPAVFDVALQSKYTRDEDSAEMCNIIRDSLTFDLGWANSLIISNLSGNLYSNNVSSGNDNFASYYASMESTWLAKIEEFCEPYFD